MDDKIDNKTEGLGGKMKEGAGKATGGSELEAQGQGDQAKSNVKQTGEKIKDVFKDWPTGGLAGFQAPARKATRGSVSRDRHHFAVALQVKVGARAAAGVRLRPAAGLPDVHEERFDCAQLRWPHPRCRPSRTLARRCVTASTDRHPTPSTGNAMPRLGSLGPRPTCSPARGCRPRRDDPPEQLAHGLAPRLLGRRRRGGLHFHDLRHTGNTLAAGTGASLRDLMTRMGHTSARAALIYQHARSERDRAITASLDDLVQRHRDGVNAEASGT